MEESSAEDNKSHFICVKCRFNFAIKQETQQAKRCPYCGESQLMRVNRFKDVNDLIDEAASEKYDY